jgi:hypothetical protein
LAFSLSVVSWEWVLYGRLWSYDLNTWSWRISTVRNRCQGTDDEDKAGWKNA